MKKKAHNNHNPKTSLHKKAPPVPAAAAGVTLVEVIIATLILAVASLGALSYQYHAVKRAKSAQAEMAATQLAQLLIEDWKSHGGDEHYDPTDLEMDFTDTGTEGLYEINLNNFPMQVELWHNDVDTDTAAGVTLREIRVTIRWRRDYQALAPLSTDPTFTSTTYVRRDQSGG